MVVPQKRHTTVFTSRIKDAPSFKPSQTGQTRAMPRSNKEIDLLQIKKIEKIWFVEIEFTRNIVIYGSSALSVYNAARTLHHCQPLRLKTITGHHVLMQASAGVNVIRG